MFLKHFESGLSIIPLHGKIPNYNKWERFCDILPPESLVQSWERIHEHTPMNIGVCLGPASGLVAVDIDTDEKTVLDSVPMSPVVRRGKKGEVRFFRYTPDIESRNYHHIGIEILSVGRQAAIPPSIHPETLKPYEWITPDTLLTFPAKDLPVLDLSFLSSLGGKFQIQKQGGGGRNNKLKDIITSMRSRGEPEHRIVNEVYEFDRLYHDPRLFMDPNEQFKARDEAGAKQAAWEMVMNVTRSLIRSGVAALEPEEVVIDLSVSVKPHVFEPKPFPKPRGMIAEFVETCEDASYGKQDVLGLGAGIAWMASLCSNRFRVEDTWPNLFILNIARSGTGKNVSQKILLQILEGSGLLGATHYKSSTSLYSDLTAQQERLDILDEASMLLQAMQSKHSHQSEMVEILSHLFSASNSKFIGASSVGSGKSHGACYNPCINLLASTTPEGFRGSVNKEMGMKGLMPRFLTFFQSDSGEFKERKNVDRRVASLREVTQEFLKAVPKRVARDFEPRKDLLLDGKGNKEAVEGWKYDPKIIPLTKESKAVLFDYQRQCFMDASRGSSFDAPFRARFAELAMKLAIVDAASSWRVEELSVDSLEWGIDVVEAAWHNASQLYELSSAENLRESYSIRVLSLIRESGRIALSELADRTKFLDLRTRREILDVLEESKRIRKVLEKTKTKPCTYYEILD